jgi:hypothetical protein
VWIARENGGVNGCPKLKSRQHIVGAGKISPRNTVAAVMNALGRQKFATEGLCDLNRNRAAISLKAVVNN